MPNAVKSKINLIISHIKNGITQIKCRASAEFTDKTLWCKDILDGI